MHSESLDGAGLRFRHLKEAVSIARFLDARGLSGNLRRSAHRLVGPCPVHRGDNPTAFVVDLHKNAWYCFTACGGGGDVVDLVRRVDGVGYAEAARRLAAIAALPLPFPPKERVPLREHQARRPFQPYTRTLRLDPEAPFLRAKGITAATARLFEAGEWRGRGFLGGCVGVHLHDASGHPLGYAGRRLGPDEVGRCGKWKFPSGLPKADLLYGVHRLHLAELPAVVVTECPWGIMRLHQLGIPAVALLGTSLSATHLCLLAHARRVVLFLDGDPAGISAARRARAVLSRRTEASIVVLPDGADPDDLPDARLVALLRPFFPS